MMAKADQIVQQIGEGIRIPLTGGYLVIYPETPIIQTVCLTPKVIFGKITIQI